MLTKPSVCTISV